jgi:hypothetical protein
MGFQKRWDVGSIESQLRALSLEMNSPYNDGWTASACKQDLFRVKCLVEDMYHSSPHFAGEEEWEKQRTVDILKRK